MCLRETAPVEGARIIWTDHEHEVIEKWAKLLREHQADVLVGYNVWQFDFRFIGDRCGVLVDDHTGDPLVDVELLGKLLEGGGETREYELNSGAYGQNKFFTMQTPGMQQIDLLQYVRREFKLESYRRVFFSAGYCTTDRMSTLLYISGLLSTMGILAGIVMSIKCKTGTSTAAQACRQMAPLMTWFSGVALFITIVLGLYVSINATAQGVL